MKSLEIVMTGMFLAFPFWLNLPNDYILQKEVKNKAGIIHD
jgi:hypothetical protein